MNYLERNLAPSVIKAGGTTVSSRELGKYMEYFKAQNPNHDCWLVVSAFKRSAQEGVTAKIKEALGSLVDEVINGGEFEANFDQFFGANSSESPYQMILRQLDDFEDHYPDKISDFRSLSEIWMGKIFDSYKIHLKKIWENTPNELDRQELYNLLKKNIVGLGEDLSAGIMSIYLKKFLAMDATAVPFILDSQGKYRFSDFLGDESLAEAWERFTGTEALEQMEAIEFARGQIRRSLAEVMAAESNTKKIKVVGGYAGLDSDSYSDVTAALIAEKLSATADQVRLVLLKDEPYIRSCNPRALMNPQKALEHQQISWNEIQDAVELTGGKPLSGGLVAVLSSVGEKISLVQVNPGKPDEPGTVFTSEYVNVQGAPCKIVIYLARSVTITIDDFNLAKMSGFIHALTKEVKDRGIQIYGSNTSGTTVSLVINLSPNSEVEAQNQLKAIEEIYERWKEGIKINGHAPIKPKTIAMEQYGQISLIGSELRDNSIAVLYEMQKLLEEKWWRIRHPLLGDKPTCMTVHLEQISEDAGNPLEIVHAWMREGRSS